MIFSARGGSAFGGENKINHKYDFITKIQSLPFFKIFEIKKPSAPPSKTRRNQGPNSIRPRTYRMKLTRGRAAMLLRRLPRQGKLTLARPPKARLPPQRRLESSKGSSNHSQALNFPNNSTGLSRLVIHVFFLIYFTLFNLIQKT